MVYGYIRVSTAHQNLENQQLEIENFARQNGIHIDKWIEEKNQRNEKAGVSETWQGTHEPKQRRGFNHLHRNLSFRTFPNHDYECSAIFS
nr:recombinase family protein [uncultured Treponema sp.]